jgi:CBS domain-containing protein
MYWPLLGGVVVGLVGYVDPRTLGVGYENIEDAINGNLSGVVLITLAAWKLLSWSVSLGSGTSGGTLAPLLTIGAALGGFLTAFVATALPGHNIDPRIGALVGMAAMFAGASRALLASVVFAFEATRQPIGLLPLLGGCSAAYLVSCLAMVNSIMTEKIARRGVRIPSEYLSDVLDQHLVAQFATADVHALAADELVATVRSSILALQTPALDHTGFPVVRDGALLGVVTHRDLFRTTISEDACVGSLVQRPPLVVHPDETLRAAADAMVVHDVGRLVVVRRAAPGVAVGILTRSDLLRANRGRIGAETTRERVREAKRPWRKLSA